MSSEINVAGVRFVPVKDAAQGVEISADYIGRLCRKGVVHGRLENSEWYVNPTSLAAWLADQTRRKDALRKKRESSAKRSVPTATNMQRNPSSLSHRTANSTRASNPTSSRRVACASSARRFS